MNMRKPLAGAPILNCETHELLGHWNDKAPSFMGDYSPPSQPSWPSPLWPPCHPLSRSS